MRALRVNWLLGCFNNNKLTPLAAVLILKLVQHTTDQMSSIPMIANSHVTTRDEETWKVNDQSG